MTEEVFRRIEDLPAGFTAASLPAMPLPRSVLMCPPDHFDVVDVKNPYMEGQVGKVDRALARRQWEALKAAFEGLGLTVELLAPVPGCEDMVFCANQTLPGIDRGGGRLCILGRMKHPSRRLEVPAFADWFASHGYEVAGLEGPGAVFEGCGDAVWHPGRRLLWGGWGRRTDPAVYPEVSRRLGVPVVALELKTERFYHLDTCFCPVDERTALVHPPSLAPGALALVRRIFPDVVEADGREASELMACNAAAFFGKAVVLQAGSAKAKRDLASRGFSVLEVETGEYMKSGGSVFCLKLSLF